MACFWASVLLAPTVFCLSMLWFVSGWEHGYSGVFIAAVAGCFFASQDNPAPFIKSFLVATLISSTAAGIYLFAFMPNVHDFGSLAILLAVPLLFGWDAVGLEPGDQVGAFSPRAADLLEGDHRRSQVGDDLGRRIGADMGALHVEERRIVDALRRIDQCIAERDIERDRDAMIIWPVGGPPVPPTAPKSPRRSRQSAGAGLPNHWPTAPGRWRGRAAGR